MMTLEVLLIAAYVVSKMAFGPASRRLCNMPYALYQVALINSFCCALLLIDRILMVKAENMIENAVNYNQLQFFVWANLLTGLFNLAMKTYFQGSLVAYACMFVYFLPNVFVINNCKARSCCKNWL